MMVERWKNLELASPSFNHLTLDFCFQKISSLLSHSSRLSWREAYCETTTLDWGWLWSKPICSWRLLIVDWQWPKWEKSQSLRDFFNILNPGIKLEMRRAFTKQIPAFLHNIITRIIRNPHSFEFKRSRTTTRINASIKKKRIIIRTYGRKRINTSMRK